MATRMQQRRGTAAEWTAANPILATGEIGYETDTNFFKIGDGVSAWSSLVYFKDSTDLNDGYVAESEVGVANGVASLDENGQIPVTQLGNLIDSAPDTLDTLNELANALTDVNGILQTELGLLETEITTAYTSAISDESTLLGNSIADVQTNVETVASDLSTEQSARLAADAVLQGEINTVSNNLITETSNREEEDGLLQTQITDNLATLTQADSDNYTALQGFITDEETARINADNAHAALTTNVHGIADTSVLEDVTGSQAKADAAQAAAEVTASGYVSDHNAETLNVHGIADTSALATSTDVAAAVTDANANTDTLIGDITVDGTSGNTVTDRIATGVATAETYADSAVSTHNSTTVGVHGIADTSKLVTTDATSQTLTGNLTIDGDLTINGTTVTVGTQDLVVNDPMIYMGEDNTGNTADLGIVASFNDGTYQHTGVVRDSSAGIWKVFKGVTDEPTTTINFAQGSLDDLAVNNIEVAGVVFTDGTQTKVGVPSITEITEKTAGYTLSAATERDTIIEMNSSDPLTVTIPNDSTVNFPVGSTLDIIQSGTGQVTIAPVDGTVIVNATPGLKLRTQWSSATLLKRAANNWVVYGDLEA